ncbi:ABC transporter ATP-binding protein [Caldicellulosiruptoraceae bacterium PP1]
MTLKLVNLSSGYTKPIIKNINMEFKKGKIYGIVGPNGCGKSTLIKTIAGILNILSGEILIDNKNILNINEKERSKLISYMSQSILINFPFKVIDIVLTGRYPYEKNQFRDSKDSIRLTEENLKLVDMFDKKDDSILEVSGGEKQRTNFARVLNQDTQIILLDEPNSSLDLVHQENMFNIIKKLKEKDKIIIAAIHNIKLAAKYCDEIILLKNGEVIKVGKPNDVFTSENIYKVYGINAIVFKNHFGLFDYEIINNNLQNINGHVHVVAGGGEGSKIYKKLLECGFEVTSGVLATNDSDYLLCNILGIYAVKSKPFTEISNEEYMENVELIKKADFCALMNIPIGFQNLKNLESLKYAKKLYIIEETPIGLRDYTNGIATKIYNELKYKSEDIEYLYKIFQGGL